MHPCTNAGVHSGTLHATCQVPVARYAMQPGWMTGVAWSPVGEALLASTDAPAIVLQLLQAQVRCRLWPKKLENNAFAIFSQPVFPSFSNFVQVLEIIF